jgi:hypothetical protein
MGADTATAASAGAALTGEIRRTHLQQLEAESIHILREVVAEAANPMMLYSIGKDSTVMLRCPQRFVASSSRVRSTRDGDRTDEEAIHRGTDHWLPA